MSVPICIVTSASDCCSDCASVLSATNSTPRTSASIIRLTAFTPPPPTPITRSCGSRTPCGPAESHWYSWAAGALPPGGAITSSGTSEENAWRRRSCGVGVRGAVRSGGAGGWAGVSRGSTPSVSVLRNSAASEPSRMLARLPLPMGEHLLRQLAIGIGRHAVGFVLEHRHPLHGSFREPHGLADPCAEDLV